MNKDEKCKNCGWLDLWNGIYICGYVAEVWLIAAEVNPKENCREDIKRFKNRKGGECHK